MALRWSDCLAARPLAKAEVNPFSCGSRMWRGPKARFLPSTASSPCASHGNWLADTETFEERCRRRPMRGREHEPILQRLPDIRIAAQSGRAQDYRYLLVGIVRLVEQAVAGQRGDVVVDHEVGVGGAIGDEWQSRVAQGRARRSREVIVLVGQQEHVRPSQNLSFGRGTGLGVDGDLARGFDGDALDLVHQRAFAGSWYHEGDIGTNQAQNGINERATSLGDSERRCGDQKGASAKGQ